MAIDWKKFTVFGFSLAIPVLILLVKRHERHEKFLAQYNSELASCTQCHKLLNAVAGTRLIMHLKDAHYMSEDRAIEVVEVVYKRLFLYKERAKGE